MKYDAVFFDSGGTLYDSGSRATVTPAQVFAGRVERVHALLATMSDPVQRKDLARAFERREVDCKKQNGASYTYHKLMEAIIEDLPLPLGSEQAACLADAYAGPRFSPDAGGLSDFEFDHFSELVRHCLVLVSPKTSLYSALLQIIET